MSRHLTIFRALLAALFGATLLAFAAPGHAQLSLTVDQSFGKAGGWSIGYSKSLNGCLAAATYRDETTVWFGLTDDRDQAYLAFTNPKWASLEPGQRYGLVLRAGHLRNWRGTFVAVTRAGERGLFARGLKEQFVLDLARAANVNIGFENRSIASLSLAGSSDAISAVLECQRDYASTRRAKAEEPPAASKERSSQGTGFFVSKAGHVLTNQHVIDGCKDVEVTRPGSPSLKASIVASDQTNDLAVLSTGLARENAPPLSMRSRIGDSVFVYGFPLSGILATTGNFTVGNVTATAGLGDDTRMVQISAPVQPGNSGGPLLDQYGNVVGVIVSKLNALRLAKLTDDVAQNVNFAIKTTIALNFLEANGVSAQLDAHSTKPMDGATIAERAREFVVRVNCR